MNKFQMIEIDAEDVISWVGEENVADGVLAYGNAGFTVARFTGWYYSHTGDLLCLDDVFQEGSEDMLAEGVRGPFKTEAEALADKEGLE